MPAIGHGVRLLTALQVLLSLVVAVACGLVAWTMLVWTNLGHASIPVIAMGLSAIVGFLATCLDRHDRAAISYLTAAAAWVWIRAGSGAPFLLLGGLLLFLGMLVISSCLASSVSSQPARIRTRAGSPDSDHVEL